MALQLWLSVSIPEELQDPLKGDMESVAHWEVEPDVVDRLEKTKEIGIEVRDGNELLFSEFFMLEEKPE